MSVKRAEYRRERKAKAKPMRVSRTDFADLDASDKAFFEALPKAARVLLVLRKNAAPELVLASAAERAIEAARRQRNESREYYLSQLIAEIAHVRLADPKRRAEAELLDASGWPQRWKSFTGWLWADGTCVLAESGTKPPEGATIH